MSIGRRIFMNTLTNIIFEQGFPFVWWDTSLGTISITVINKNKNKVTENFDRAFISKEGCERLAHAVAEKIIQRFEENRYDKEYEWDWKKHYPFLKV